MQGHERKAATVPISWSRAATRLRALQAVQLAALVLLAVVAALSATVVARELDRLSSERDRAEQAVSRLVGARDTLRGAQAEFFRFKALNPGEKGLTGELVVDIVRGGGELRLLADEQRGRVPPEVEASGRESLAAFGSLLSLADANLATRPGTARDQAALERLERVTIRLDRATDRWLVGLEDARDRETARLEGLRDTLVRRVGLVAGLLAAAAIILWLILDRLRGRVVAALRSAGEEQHAQSLLATAAAEGADIPRIAAVAAREVLLVLGCDTAAVAMDDRGTPVVVAAAGAPPGELVAALARATATGAPARIDSSPARRARERSGDDPVCVAVPVVVDGVRWGALGAVLGDGARADAESPRLARVAATLALAVGSAEARRRLTDQASSDPLTGLANHRAFQDRLVAELEAARATGRELAVVLLDIDHFKAVNDGLGHQAGDEVLAEVARRLRAEAREEDLVARVGGEEFAWLMPGADGMHAYSAAERARHAVRASRVERVPLVTVSAGVATARDAASAAELVQLADAALYWSKANGRDLSCRWSPEITAVVGDGDREARLARLKALAAIQALARAVDARDPYTFRHSERVAELTHLLAIERGWDPARAVRLREAALLHDVGKVGVPDAVLLKPGPLTPDEFAQVRRHAALGAQIVAGVLEPEQVAWVHSHHERFDGGGYPDGRSGQDIPEGSRLMAVADTFDAMTTDRPYRSATPPADAIAACLAERGAQLCPDALDALDALWRSGRMPAPGDGRDRAASATTA